MGATIERTDRNGTLRRTAEITLAALLHDIGKVFQRADWPLSQTAEKLEESLCPIVDGRPVHRHILWSYDFCSDNLKWLADYVDLARVIQLVMGHHKAVLEDPAALILDAADRLAAGASEVEIEELQAAIPPQVPLESILWEISGRLAPAEPSGKPEPRPKSRRVQRSSTSAAEASEPGPAGPEAGAEPAEATEGQAPAEGATLEGAVPQAPSAAPVWPVDVAPVRKGYIKAQLLRADEDVLPTPKRPEMNEQDYRAIGTDLVAICQKIGRMSVRPRIEWLLETLRGVLEQRLSLVPEYVGSGGQTVSLYSHAAATAAIAAGLWQWHEKTGSLPGAQERPLSLTAVQIEGVDEFLSRPAASESSSRVYRGRATLVRLVSRLLGDVLLAELGLPSVSRLWEGDDCLTILADGSDTTAAAIQQFAEQQGARLFAQSGGYLRLAVAEPVRFGTDALRGGWGEIARGITQNLKAVKSRPAAELLQTAGAWREEAAVLNLTDRHGVAQEPGEWARLAEAYERQLGTSLARGKTIAAYNSPVSPAGAEGEPTAIGPWFVHVGVSAEGLAGWEGLEQIYSIGEGEESWAWVPAWQGLPHGPTFRRADESQLRADPSPERERLDGPARRRETPIAFEELGWLSRRSRKGRGFVGRSWLGCLRLEADGIGGGCSDLIEHCNTLGQAVEAARQAQWFWQEFLEGQLRRADRATWRVFVLRCGAGEATLVGPWNTMMVLAGRAEQWWRRWTGSLGAWPVRGALVFGARDVPVTDLAWQAEAGLAEADPAEGAGRIWILERARTWTSYREALRLGALLDEQMQGAEPLGEESGLAFCRRLLAHEQQSHGVGGGKQAKGSGRVTAWRAALAQDVRKLLLRHWPPRGKRTAAQEDLLQQLDTLITGGRRGKMPGSVGIAARMALWQNQGETS